MLFHTTCGWIPWIGHLLKGRIESASLLWSIASKLGRQSVLLRCSFAWDSQGWPGMARILQDHHLEQMTPASYQVHKNNMHCRCQHCKS